MKKRLLLFFLSVFSFGNAQINVNEGFESGALPSGWFLLGGGSSVSSTTPISGLQSVQFSTSVSSGAKDLWTADYTSTGNAINISFLTKEVGPGFVTYEVLYKINNNSGVTAGYITRQASNTAQNNTYSIPAGAVSAGNLVDIMIRTSVMSGSVTNIFVDDVVVSQGTVPTFSQIATQCLGATFVLPNTSTNGIIGTWTPAINNSSTTTYIFTPASGQNAITTSMTIEVVQPITPTGNAIQNFTNTIFNGKKLSDIVVYPSNVVWYSSIRNAVSGTNPLSNNTPLVSRNTYYAVNIIGNCRSTPFGVTVNITNFSNGNKIQVNSDIKVYPNPANDVLHIETALEIQSIEVYTLQGQKVLSSKQKEVNVSDLAAGIYMIHIQDIKNNVETKRIIIE